MPVLALVRLGRRDRPKAFRATTSAANAVSKDEQASKMSEATDPINGVQ